MFTCFWHALWFCFLAGFQLRLGTKMKKYKSSDLTHKRAEVLKEAKANGVIIEKRSTNGDVDIEYLLVLKPVNRADAEKLFPKGDL